MIVQASVTGALDFRDARPLDRRWHKRLRWTLDYLDRQNDARVVENLIQQHLAVLDYNGDDNQFSTHWDEANRLRARYGGLVSPWGDWAPPDPQELAAQMHEEYVATFGDPQDPEFDAEMDRLIAYWEGKDAA